MEQKKREIEAAAGETRPERKAYAAPKLVEWGALAELTGGEAGGNQDRRLHGHRDFVLSLSCRSDAGTVHDMRRDAGRGACHVRLARLSCLERGCPWRRPACTRS